MVEKVFRMFQEIQSASPGHQLTQPNRSEQQGSTAAALILQLRVVG